MVQIRKAVRKKAKLRLGIAAPSGAGKTYSSLLMAFGLGEKVGLIDTEQGSGDLYADLGDYDIIQIEAPYTIDKYLQAIKAFEQAEYDVIIIDSLSHAWAGDGGLLDKQSRMTGNSYANWRQITPEHNALVNAILQSPSHIIATMRSKQEYVLVENEKGKQAPQKMGMAPVQREGMEYEFTVMFDINVQHNASTTKDRTRLFDGKIFKITKETGEELLTWLNDGVTKEQAELNNFKEQAANVADLVSLKKLFAIAYTNLNEKPEQHEAKQIYDELKLKIEEASNEPKN